MSRSRTGPSTHRHGSGDTTRDMTCDPLASGDTTRDMTCDPLASGDTTCDLTGGSTTPAT